MAADAAAGVTRRRWGRVKGSPERLVECPGCSRPLRACNLARHVARCEPCPGCGDPKPPRARTCRACRPLPGGTLTSAVLERYPEESAAEIAASVGTTEMAVYNTASRLRRRSPGSVGYRHERD